MFRRSTPEEVAAFRPIYHQTTPWPNPIIESVLYDDRGRGLGAVFCYGDPLNANYVITHRSGFTYAHINPDRTGVAADYEAAIDRFMQDEPAFSHYLMFYAMPDALATYITAQGKPHFNRRTRRKYRIDVRHFETIDPTIYTVPEGHRLLTLREAGAGILAAFEHKLEQRFYNSWDDLIDNSSGYVLLDPEGAPVALAYVMCQVGRIADIDLIVRPEHRKRGYGAMIITHLVRECHRRGLEAHWDCFITNHTDKLVREVYGVERIYLEYDMITYLNRPNPV